MQMQFYIICILYILKGKRVFNYRYNLTVIMHAYMGDLCGLGL